MSDATYEDTVLAADLRPGDVLLSTALGGHEGEIRSVRVYPEYVALDWQGGGGVALGAFEVCSVKRTRRPQVHPIIADVLSAHGFGR